MIRKCIKLLLLLRIVPMLANDTLEELAARVLRQEHKMYAEVATAICEERVVWRVDCVPSAWVKPDSPTKNRFAQKPKIVEYIIDPRHSSELGNDEEIQTNGAENQKSIVGDEEQQIRVGNYEQ